MTFDEMKTKADAFFDFPTDDKTYVTLTSCVLFALQAYNAGIDRGRAAGQAAEREAIIELAHDVADHNGWGWDGDCDIGNNIEKAIRARGEEK